LKTLLIKISVILPLFLVPIPVLAQNALTTVVSVGDGDTLRVRSQGKTITIRLGCIDSPETAQKPWGQQSASRLKQLLPPGQAVQVRKIDQDRYERTVAELYLGNQSVNLQMVKEGHAVVYRQYLNSCAATKNQYLQAEKIAKQKRLGFWNQREPVMPWNFRRGKSTGNRSNGARLTPVAPQTNNLSACVQSNCNCSNFKTQAEAQQVLAAFPTDPHQLDGDKNGVACESFP